MSSIPFTQYLRPDGRRKQVLIERPDEIVNLARKIVALGFLFECEELATGHASLTIAGEKEDVAIEVVPNGPEVPDAVDRLVKTGAELLGIETPPEPT